MTNKNVSETNTEKLTPWERDYVIRIIEEYKTNQVDSTCGKVPKQLEE